MERVASEIDNFANDDLMVATIVSGVDRAFEAREPGRQKGRLCHAGNDVDVVPFVFTRSRKSVRQRSLSFLKDHYRETASFLPKTEALSIARDAE